MEAVTHLEKVITGEVSAVTHLEKVIAGETSAVTYTEKVIAGEAPPVTHLQKVIAGEASPVTHLEYVWVGGTPSPTEHEYTGAVPYTFTANGSPLISWRISGNTVQNGTPTPDNPIQPSECGERTGNLIRFTNTTSTSGGGALIRQTADKSEIVIISRTATEADGSVTLDILAELSAGTYTLSVDGIIDRGSRNVDRIFIRDKDNNVIVNNVQTGKPNQFTISEDAKITKLSIVFAAVAEYNNQVVRIMLNSGSTALPYEPYGYKIPISSASTPTPVYLGEVQSTRNIRKLVLTGNEEITSVAVTGGLAFVYNPTPYTPNQWKTADNVLSSHYKSEYSNNDGNIYFTTTRLVIVDFACSTIDEFKAYLAQQYANGTPVTVWYVLAEPTTGIVNEPLRKIGDYADTLSMEQAGVSIPTNNGSTTVDVETTLKPSEVYIKYKGV